MTTRRRLLATAAWGGAIAALRPLRAFAQASPAVFDVTKYGAKGDATTLDTAAIQRAIDAAAAAGGHAQVLLPGGRKFLTGTLVLKGAIDFHLADDAQVLISTNREDYLGGLAGSSNADTMGSAAGGVIIATNTQGMRISGTGTFQGRAREFMTGYDKPNEWWLPKPFRPKMFVLTGCKDLEVRDITFAEAPNWGLHLLGCDGVLVDNVKVRNLLDVPNCDGIDPDHSRNVEIKNCNLVCGDDGVVIKCSRQTTDFGPAANIHVAYCVIETQDAGLKIGTETTSDIHDIVFERCQIKTSSRGLCIQLRDEGSINNIVYRDITFTSRFYSDPWWGRGEAISFTAIPRTPTTKLGTLHDVSVRNVTGHAENSVRVEGYRAAPDAPSSIRDVSFENVKVTLNRTTQYKGGLFDNRPTTAMEAIQPHDTPGFSIEHADNVSLRDCTVAWGPNSPDYFSYAVEAVDAKDLKLEGLHGGPAHIALGKATSIR